MSPDTREADLVRGTDTVVDRWLDAVADRGREPVDLGRLDERCDAATVRRLDELARLRRGGIGAPLLHGRTTAAVTPEWAAHLAAAGVGRIRIDAAPDASAGHRLQRVRTLDEAGIAVAWSAPAAVQERLRDVVAAVEHLTPPEDLDPDVLGPWIDGRRATLTYARGPGFMRVLDKRRWRDGPAFVVLRGMQQRLYLTLREPHTIPGLAAGAGLDEPVVRRFVEQLVEARLAVPTAPGEFLGLAVCRPRLQRWTAVG